MGIRSEIFSLSKKKVCESSDKQKNALPKNNCDCFNKKRQNRKKRIDTYTLCLFIFLSLQYTQNLLTKKKMIKYLMYRVCSLLSLLKKSGRNLTKQLFSRNLF